MWILGEPLTVYHDATKVSPNVETLHIKENHRMGESTY